VDKTSREWNGDDLWWFPPSMQELVPERTWQIGSGTRFGTPATFRPFSRPNARSEERLYFDDRSLKAAVEAGGLVPQRLSTHESFSGWFLAILRTVLRGKGCGTDGHAGFHAGRRPVLEHLYQAAMALAGVISLPFRLIQQALGKGDELVVLGTQS
jgi:hypothetical protein